MGWVQRVAEIHERRRSGVGGKRHEDVEPHSGIGGIVGRRRKILRDRDCTAEAIGLRSLLKDLGCAARVRVWTDSAAAKSIASRRGIGKIRHPDVNYLWVQEMTRQKQIQMKKVHRSMNPSDILTRPRDVKEIERLAGLMKVKIGRRGGA